jgi:hypothetical protein
MFKVNFLKASETIARDNQGDAYCGWYCRSVWRRKVDMSKVARNAPGAGCIRPISVSSSDDLRAKSCLSPSLIGTSCSSKPTTKAIYLPLIRQNGRQTTQVGPIAFSCLFGPFTYQFCPGLTSTSSWTPLRFPTPFPKSKRSDLLQHLF